MTTRKAKSSTMHREPDYSTTYEGALLPGTPETMPTRAMVNAINLMHAELTRALARIADLERAARHQKRTP